MKNASGQRSPPKGQIDTRGKFFEYQHVKPIFQYLETLEAEFGEFLPNHGPKIDYIPYC